MSTLGTATLLLAASVASAAAGQDPSTPEASGAQAEVRVVRKHELVPATMTAEEASVVNDRALAWLLRTQREDGAWGTGACENLAELGFSVETYYAWHVAANALAVMALMEAPETPERLEALERGLRWLCTTRIPLRGSNWDVDEGWSNLYGFVACARAAGDARFQEAPWNELTGERGAAFLERLLETQSPDGGWAYYDDPPFSRRPTWSTSFCTALVLPWLQRAGELGWHADEVLVSRARRYVRRCRLPNGAYEYDLNPVPRISGGEHINNVKGSLGRIQVCNWALSETGEPSTTPDLLREGLELFFEHHKFLDVARMRPIPHEAYYANAGYFYFFGHYYAAQAINRLPMDEREAMHARLRPQVAKTMRADGSSSDFMSSTYMVTASTSSTLR